MRNGFTLIELLAVIVILSIIALIATPIVLNIINDSKESAQLRSADFYLDGVDYAVAKSILNNKNIQDGTYSILEDGNICLEYDSDNKCKDILKVEVDGEVPSGGIITIQGGKISDISLNLSDKIVVKNDEGKLVFSEGKSCTLTDDKDNDGIADTGDMITCSTESFHVISNDGETISMLAQYNLNVGDYAYRDDTIGIQNENATELTGTFSTTNNWVDRDNGVLIIDANYASEGRSYPFVYGDYKDADGNQQNTIYPYVKAYEEYLISENVKSAKTTLISYEQLETLGCSIDTGSCTSSQYNWTYSTRYWTGSVSDDPHNLFGVIHNGSFLSDLPSSVDSFGIRPVVNISVNEL